MNTFSCSWPEDKYGNWIPRWVTWPLLWQLSIRLNLYNMLKLLLKFPINMLLIYSDRPPPLFFHVVYPFHIRSVSTATGRQRDSHKTVGLRAKERLGKRMLVHLLNIDWPTTTWTFLMRSKMEDVKEKFLFSKISLLVYCHQSTCGCL